MFNFFSTKSKKYEDIPAGTFHDLMLQPDTVIIDVRTAGEFAGGKIRGARNLDIMSSSFASQVKNLPKDKIPQFVKIMADLKLNWNCRG